MTNIIYLDNAATTFPKPPEIYDFMIDFYRTNGVNPGRTGCDLALAAEKMINDTRQMLTKFFGAKGDYNRLVFSYNASDSLNIIINGVLNKGDHVVSTVMEHNSVLRPLNFLQKEGKITVDWAKADKKGLVAPDEIKRLIRKNTKLVIVNHGSNVVGSIQPIKEIGAICRAKGILFAIDAAQTAGMVPINMEEINIDLLAFTGHKSLFGPTGIGGLYVREGVDVKPLRHGGTGVRSAYPYHLEEYPWRLECGTLNMVGIAGLYAGQKWIAKQGFDNIRQHEMKLAKKLVEGLYGIEGVTVYCPKNMENRLPVISVNVDGFESADVGVQLDVDHDIITRTGLHCAPKVHETIGTIKAGTTRLSIGPFNTIQHIETAISAVKGIAQAGLQRVNQNKIVYETSLES
ncbi:MAG: aminotransferase class V-fold PLP-dependent enzyme [Planctomycetes bacterium]|nr:aminotransferase class V-fold PLP-dependent enzyme [Planctomycetota bacterium]